MAEDNKWTITIDKFYKGLAPTYWKNSKSSYGDSGHANDMQACDVLDPTFITQGPGLADLTNGSSLGQAIQYIVQNYVDTGLVYALGTSKLYELSITTVTNDSDFPHSITDCIEGESIICHAGILYYFFNESGAGEIGKHTLGTSTFDDDWGSTVPTGGAALVGGVPHPSFLKDGLIAFGNGRYLGFYDTETDTLTPQQVDFGVGAVIADVTYSNGYWYINVNRKNISTSETTQIYLYGAGGVSSLLADEVALRMRELGFIRNINGTIYVSYYDAGGRKIGYLSGKQIVQIGVLGSDVIKFNQVSERDGVLLVCDGVDIYAIGSIDPTLPIQMSMYMDGDGSANVTAIGQNGIQMIVGRDNGATYRMSLASGYSILADWTSLIFDMVKDGLLAQIDRITVLTPSLGANARCDLYIKTNQEAATSSAMQITTAAKTRHVFKKNIRDIQDLRVVLDWANGSTSVECPIREIQITGHWQENI